MLRSHEPCVWHLCPNRSDDTVPDVHLVWEGRSYTKSRVPLCNSHLREFIRSKRMRLKPEFLLAPERR